MDRYQETFDTYDKLATAYQDKFMYMELYNDTYDRFIALIDNPHANILEIACGPGNITKYLLSKQPDYCITATDAAPKMVQLAQLNNPAAHCTVMDCRHMDALAGPYDGIMCGFCMPYLSKDDCAKLVNDCAKLLPENGVLYLSAIEGDYNTSGYETSSNGDKMYVYNHEPAYLQQLLQLHHFTSIELMRKEYTTGDGTQSIHMVFIAKR